MNQRILTTPRFSVEHRVYTRPDGRTFERDVVVHPGAVVILPVLADGRIVMIRNFRHAVEQELWELPAGTREPDETPVKTAHRELVEESGYRAETMTPLVEFYASPGVMTERMFVFLGTGLTFVGQRLEPGEQIRVQPLAPNEVRRMMLSNELQDAKTLAALGLYFLREAC